MGPRILGGTAVAFSIVLLFGCARTGPNPAERPAIDPPEPEPSAQPLEPTATTAAPVAWQPAPVLGAPIGPETVPTVRLEQVEGVDAARANAAFTRAAAAAQDCAGAGTVLHVRVRSNDKGNDVDVEPKTVLDDVQRRCVIDALSTVRLDDPSSGATNELVRSSGRYSAQFLLSW